MAKRIAEAKSTHPKYLHVAFITSGKRIISVGYNKNNEHAEAVAIKRLKRSKLFNGDTPRYMVLTSLMFKRKNGHMGNSFPCKSCLNKIAKIGINWITYVEEGTFRIIS